MGAATVAATFLLHPGKRNVINDWLQLPASLEFAAFRSRCLSAWAFHVQAPQFGRKRKAVDSFNKLLVSESTAEVGSHATYESINTTRKQVLAIAQQQLCGRAFSRKAPCLRFISSSVDQPAIALCSHDKQGCRRVCCEVMCVAGASRLDSIVRLAHRSRPHGLADRMPVDRQI